MCATVSGLLASGGKHVRKAVDEGVSKCLLRTLCAA